MWQEFDIQSSCSTCLKIDCPLRCIYEVAVDEKSFAEILESLHLRQSHELLSTNICFRCQETAIISYEFQQKVLSSESIIANMILENELSADVVDQSEDAVDLVEDGGSPQHEIDVSTEALDEVSADNSCFVKDSPLNEDFSPESLDNFDAFIADDCLQTQLIPTNIRVATSTTNGREDSRSILKIKPKKIKPMIKDESGRFVCHLCRGSYATRNILTHHLLKHTRSKDFACNLCPRRFYFQKDLKVHIKVHMDRTRHNCSICSQDYSTSAALKKHVLTHMDNPKDFQCGQCNMAFRTKGNLEVHLRTHNGAKPYVCTSCPDGKAFTQKITLQRHMKSVHNECIYSCQWCDEPFEKHGELREHWRECKSFRSRLTVAEDENIRNETAIQSINMCFNED